MKKTIFYNFLLTNNIYSLPKEIFYKIFIIFKILKNKMFIGDGAKLVRDAFELAKEK